MILDQLRCRAVESDTRGVEDAEDSILQLIVLPKLAYTYA